MWETFIQNIIGELIGALIGAAISIPSAVLIVRRQERAKLDLKQSRHLERHLRALILLLESHEKCLEKKLTSSERCSGLGRKIDKYLWKLIRGADDPDLSTKKRDTLLRELKRITPRHFEYLRTSLDPPVPPDPFKQANNAFVPTYGWVCDLVDRVDDQQEKLKNIRELKGELKQLLPVLRSEKLLTRIKPLLVRIATGVLKGFAMPTKIKQPPDPDKGLPLREMVRTILLMQKKGVKNGEYGERYENYENVYILDTARSRLNNLDKCDEDRIGQRIKQRIKWLAKKAKNPKSACRMTIGSEEFYKLCVGDYRIIYEVLDEKRIVIHAIGYWWDFYRRCDP